MKPGRQSATHAAPEVTLPPTTVHPLAEVYAEFAGGTGRELTVHVAGGGGAAEADNRQQEADYNSGVRLSCSGTSVGSKAACLGYSCCCCCCCCLCGSVVFL
jgi:hypothetical protein